jgi:predicted transcriptional regulator
MPAKADTFSVRLPDNVKTQVEELARLTKRSRSFIINEAVSTYMQDRADYIRDLNEAVKSAESGVGHSSEQIFGWMRSWGTANELPSPAPDILPRK